MPRDFTDETIGLKITIDMVGESHEKIETMFGRDRKAEVWRIVGYPGFHLVIDNTHDEVHERIIHA